MNGDQMRERFGQQAINQRERRMVAAVESIAANLEQLNSLVALYFYEVYRCDPFARIAEMGVKAPPEVEIRERQAS